MAVVQRRLGAFTGEVFIGLLSLPWRLRFHLLLYASRCPWIPFVGMMLVGWSMPVLRLASVSDESGIFPVKGPSMSRGGE